MPASGKELVTSSVRVLWQPYFRFVHLHISQSSLLRPNDYFTPAPYITANSCYIIDVLFLIDLLGLLMKSLFVTTLLALLLAAPFVSAQTNDKQVLVKQRGILLSQRVELQTTVHNAEQHLRQLDRDRYDKLEELEQLYKAYKAVNPKYAFSAAAGDEIAAQTSSLNIIQKERSDCLEELDCLYAGLSKLNGEIANCDKAIK